MEALIALNAFVLAAAIVVSLSAHLLRVVAAHAAARAVYLDELRKFQREAKARAAEMAAKSLEAEEKRNANRLAAVA